MNKNIRFGFLLLVFLLYLLVLVSASSEVVVKNGWIPYETTIVKGGDTFQINSFYSGSSSDIENLVLIVRKNNDSLVSVDFGDCKETLHYKYCLLNASLSNDLVDIDSKGSVRPALLVNLVEYSLSNKLIFSRTFSKTKLHLDDVTTVDIHLSNDGDFVLSNVDVEEPIPDGFELVSKETNLIRRGNRLTAFFNLYPGAEWTSSYSLRPLSYDSLATYNTFVSYLTEDGLSKNISGSEETLKVITPFSYTVSLNKDSFDIDDPIKFSLSLKNTDSSEIVLKNITLLLDTSLKNPSTSNLDRKSDGIFFSKNNVLSSGDDLSFVLDGILTNLGSFLIRYSGFVEANGEVFYFEGNKTFSVSTKGLSCFFDLDGNLTASKKIIYSLNLVNDDNDDFYEFSGSFRKTLDGLSDETLIFNRSVVNKGSSKKLFGKSFVLPYFVEPSTINLSFQGSYRTKYNQWLVLNCSLSEQIHPLDRLVDIVLGNYSINRSSSKTLNFSLVNSLDDDLSIILSSDSWSDDVSLDALGSVVEFVDLSVPDDYPSSFFIVPFSLTIPDLSYEDNFSLKVFVSNPLNNSDARDSSLNDSDSSSINSSSDVVVSIRKKKTMNPKGHSFWDQLVFLFNSIFS